MIDYVNRLATFSTASEFDPYSLVDVLRQVEDGFPLAFT
jgi:hypothetical protein